MTDLTKFNGQGGIAFARDTIEQLAERGIATSPANYELWTAHRLGTHPALSAEIEAIIAKGDPFTEEVNASLYERFFASTKVSIQVKEASDTIARELTQVVATLREAGDQSGSFAETLHTAATTFDGEVDTGKLRVLVGGLTKATREMADRNAEMSAQLKTSSDRVEALQTELQSVKIQALTDGLTGLANRKLFDETWPRRLHEASGRGENLCLLLCDIDHFKQFNDTWGHLVGDQVLRFVGAALTKQVPPDCVVARYGGEEFAIIMPRMDLAKALELVEAIQTALRTRYLVRRSTGENLGFVKLSFGLTRCRDGEDPNEVIARADGYLYASKRGGRDRITSDFDAEESGLRAPTPQVA